MKRLFVCNNFFHLAVAHCAAVSCPDIESKLLVLGQYNAPPRSALSRSSVFSVVEEFECSSACPSIGTSIRGKLRRVDEIINDLDADSVLFFVDKSYLNQVFLSRMRDADFVLVEEGIGLYNNLGVKPAEYFRILASSFLGFGFLPKLKSAEQGGNGYHERLICRYPELLPEKKRCDSILTYDRVFSDEELERLKKVMGVNIGVENDRKNCLFVGSGVEITAWGWISEQEERDQLYAVFSAISQLGFDCYVKAHPREKNGKYRGIFPGAIELEQSIPVEIAAHVLKPDLAISYMSTGLLNLSQPRSLVYLYNLIESEFANKCTLRKLKKFNDRVFAPNSIVELVDALSIEVDNSLGPACDDTDQICISDVIRKLG